MRYTSKTEKWDLRKLHDAHGINMLLHRVMTVASIYTKALLKMISPDLNVLNVRFCHPRGWSSSHQNVL